MLELIYTVLISAHEVFLRLDTPDVGYVWN